jgi:hypothetical protein
MIKTAKVAFVMVFQIFRDMQIMTQLVSSLYL